MGARWVVWGREEKQKTDDACMRALFPCFFPLSKVVSIQFKKRCVLNAGRLSLEMWLR